MGNTKPIGVAYSDPELTDVTISGSLAVTGVTTVSATTVTAGTLAATTATVGGKAITPWDTMTAGAGFAGTGTIYKTSVVKEGDIWRTDIFIDLTGTASSTTDLDIIGTSGVSYIGQVTAAKNGTTIQAGRMLCLEAPAGGVADIDVYSATEGTGAFDGGIAALAETALITAGGAWTNGASKGFTTVPAANEYLYLTCGAAGTPATYTAGKFLITIWGA